MKKNDIIELTITDVSNDSNGVGRYENMAIFVPKAVTNDKLKVRIVKVLKNYAFGIVEEIIEPSNKRAKQQLCPVFGKCGGCSLRHISYSEEVKIKNNWVFKNMKKFGKTEFSHTNAIPSKKENHYRNKAIYQLGKDSQSRIIAGFYAKRSHRIIPAENCLLHPDFFGVILNSFTHWANKNSLSIYNESTGKGILRALYIRFAEGSGEVMVTIIANANDLPFKKDLIDILTSSCPKIVSIILNVNKEKTNVLLGNKCHTLFGKDSITEILLGNKFNISPLAFLQVNHETCQILYKKAIGLADPKPTETILDLYCGAGTIGLSIAKNVKKVIGVEIIPAAIENARQNALLNKIENAEFICADAPKAATQIKSQGISIDTVIIDPPRKGCDSDLIKTIKEISPKKVVMISCDSSTAARDLKIFKENDFTPTALQTIDMFPRTSHVETIIMMTYCGDKGKK